MSSELDPQTDQLSESDQPSTRHKRRRLGSIKFSQVRRYDLDGKYNDAYRELFNQDVDRAAARFEVNHDVKHHTKQIGASLWSSQEQAIFFAALQRLGRADIPGLTAAIGTKSVPEVQQLLLLLQQAVPKHGDANLSLRDIPAAIEVGQKCNDQLDAAGETLAWYQELFEANQEQDKFGDLWLITSAIANDIEHAITSRTRPDSTPPPVSDRELPRRGGHMSAGSCISCKQFKQKCNRENPCGNCIRRNIPACMYPEKVVKKAAPDSSERPTHGNVSTNSNLLEKIPEAGLIQPDILLMLSKKYFMNRCPTLPSPWLHWSQYTSELTKEPAIYRSAFNDFHSLVISVTRRLAQTAIMQATSRLRSQQRRLKRNTLPCVKRRDVLAAIDVVGMKRNGRERWRGVARRCALRVFKGREDYIQSSKYKTEMSWDEVEQHLAFSETAVDPLLSDAGTSENDANSFRLRASRRGTPLPMEKLALSDPEEQSEYSDISSDTEMDDETRSPLSRPSSQPMDHFGNYPSVTPATAGGQSECQPQTLEQFDQQASKQEEKALWQMLELEAPADEQVARTFEEEEEGSWIDETVVAETNDWRGWIEYKPQWEVFRTPVPFKLFSVNQKTMEEGPTAQSMFSSDLQSTDMETSVGKGMRRLNPRTELRTKGTRRYAALQGRSSISHNNNNSAVSDSSEFGSDDAHADVPMRSTEDDGQVVNVTNSDAGLDEGVQEDEMDWG